ncbi:MAG: hypothetical protein ACREN1_04085 [Candidatus Dormibacteria bacterium]
MDQPVPGPPADRDPEQPGGGPPPEVLDPESPRYQPWAEKQITNAAKEKRPLEDFLAEFDAKLAGYGDRESGSWDPNHQERLLAKFSPATTGSGQARRRRRRPAGGGGAPRPPVRGQPIRATPAAVGGDSPERSSTRERRRRRRRRPRAGRRPGGPTTPE